MNFIIELFEKLPPLHAKKNPTTASILGFLLGGIGLGIYFKSFIDFIIPVAIAFGVILAFQDPGTLGGMIIAALWGYFRVITSNEKLAPTKTVPSMSGGK